MYSYSMVQWLFFFYLYCFAGWCIESAYVSIRTRKLTNRGFMRGPFLPIYGSGAIMMLVVSMPFQDNIVMTYVAGCIGATVLEYVTGVTMELLFKMRYWDYSDKPLNFQGHICLGSTLSWGFLTILMTEIVHVPVERLVLSLLTDLDVPVVLDADGINALAGHIDVLDRRQAPTVLTPHEGEFSRLTGCALPVKDRLSAARDFSGDHGCVLVLKGQGTATAASDGSACINTSGNPGMAKGGSGDVLTGLIGGLLAQGASPFGAAVAGAWLHGRAAQLCARDHTRRAMVPSQLMEYFGRAFLEAEQE